jgi:hypothetical protein
MQGALPGHLEVEAAAERIRSTYEYMVSGRSIATSCQMSFSGALRSRERRMRLVTIFAVSPSPVWSTKSRTFRTRRIRSIASRFCAPSETSMALSRRLAASVFRTGVDREAGMGSPTLVERLQLGATETESPGFGSSSGHSARPGRLPAGRAQPRNLACHRPHRGCWTRGSRCRRTRRAGAYAGRLKTPTRERARLVTELASEWRAMPMSGIHRLHGHRQSARRDAPRRAARSASALRSGGNVATAEGRGLPAARPPLHAARAMGSSAG